MALQATALERAFRYNSVDLVDPGAQYSPDQVRDFYSTAYPEIVSAGIDGPEQQEGKLVYTFRRAVGTKGADYEERPDGMKLIAAERLRQIHAEGWTPEHDDEHTAHELTLAACAYAAPDVLYLRRATSQRFITLCDCWPEDWDRTWDKRPRINYEIATADELSHVERIKNLAKAGALIAAEIDRIQRILSRKNKAQA